MANDTEFLSDIGFLGPDVLAVHCVHCTTARHSDAATVTMRRCRTIPCSNMYLASGCAPIPEMLRKAA
jgi:5-methylthioadenosine/S-adenosylhomocysteine deaminase